jgi:hypothetical protein
MKCVLISNFRYSNQKIITFFLNYISILTQLSATYMSMLSVVEKKPMRLKPGHVR